jgi:hypothetical protein
MARNCPARLPLGVAPGVRHSVTSNATIAMPVTWPRHRTAADTKSKNALRGAALTLDHRELNGLEWLAGLIHAVEQLVDALPSRARKRVSNGFARQVVRR